MSKVGIAAIVGLLAHQLFFIRGEWHLLAPTGLFHRLRNFPGPRFAAVSKLWHIWQCRDSRNHLVLEDLRRQYGSFVLTALTEYEPRVLKKVSALRDRILEANPQLVLVNDLMRWFSFDLMGDFAFSEDFGMMEKREYHRAVRMLRSAITLLESFSLAIWITRLGFAFIPGLWKVKDWFGLLEFCDGYMERRMKARAPFNAPCLL
ncbi:MAG: hypothetical protein Q9179_005896 [Wetmoreana sp. 5 TL-2023]